MGSLFRYIEDSALCLADTDDKCDRCCAEAVSYGIDAMLEGDTDYIEHALCVDCIGSIPLRQLRGRQSELAIQTAVNRYHPKGTLSGEGRLNRTVDICDAMRRTPQILMFLQNEDWPTCCGDLAEFVGDTPPAGNQCNDYECWDDPASFVAQFKLTDFYPLSRLEVMNTMSLFHCLHCSLKYWVFQFSGLMWPGPLVDVNGDSGTA